MSSRKSFRRAPLSQVARYSIRKRLNRASIAAFARPAPRIATASRFLESLPRFLKADDFRDFLGAVHTARRRGRPFHLLLGAHTIKVGLAPLIIDLMQREIVTGLSFTGAGLIHDLELAFFGGTSEDVEAGLQDGSFGMVEETALLYVAAAELAAQDDLGLGEAAGRLIMECRAPHRRISLFGQAHRFGLPATVHVGIGTDIVNQHPEFDAAAVGRASHVDFQILAAVCGALDRGGVAANIGSAVLLPEVFLKALTVARNLRKGRSRLTTANFDMIEHYRPRVNVVTRPTVGAGRGFNFIGHHEIMVPLLAWGLRDKFDPRN